MNSEERHRLKTNELGQAVQAVGHRLENHVTKIVAVVCGILVIAAAAIWWSRYSSTSAAAAWTMLENAQNVDDFGLVREKYRGTTAGRWALLRESELYLQSGMAQMFENRELALTDLKKSKEGFEQLVGNKSDQVMQERALWGLSQVLEATCDGDTTKAVESYQRLLNDVPETYFKAIAEQRIASLKTGGAKEFYAWYSKQNPKPRENRPKDGFDFDSMHPSPGKSEFEPPNSEGGKSTKGTLKSDGEMPTPETDPKKTEEAPAIKDGDVKPNEKPEADKVPDLKTEKDGEKKEIETKDVEKKDGEKKE